MRGWRFAAASTSASDFASALEVPVDEGECPVTPSLGFFRRLRRLIAALGGAAAGGGPVTTVSSIEAGASPRGPGEASKKFIISLNSHLIASQYTITQTFYCPVSSPPLNVFAEHAVNVSPESSFLITVVCGTRTANLWFVLYIEPYLALLRANPKELVQSTITYGKSTLILR